MGLPSNIGSGNGSFKKHKSKIPPPLLEKLLGLEETVILEKLEQKQEQDLMIALLQERLERLELEDKLKRLEKLEPLEYKFPLLETRFNELKERYIDTHTMLEKTTEYYKNQLSAANRLQSSNKGMITLDCIGNKQTFDLLVEKIFEPDKKYIHFKYVDNKMTKIE